MNIRRLLLRCLGLLGRGRDDVYYNYMFLIFSFLVALWRIIRSTTIFLLQSLVVVITENCPQSGVEFWGVNHSQSLLQLLIGQQYHSWLDPPGKSVLEAPMTTGPHTLTFNSQTLVVSDPIDGPLTSVISLQTEQSSFNLRHSTPLLPSPIVSQSLHPPPVFKIEVFNALQTWFGPSKYTSLKIALQNATLDWKWRRHLKSSI